jgi:hypothetical protein
MKLDKFSWPLPFPKTRDVFALPLYLLSSYARCGARFGARQAARLIKRTNAEPCIAKHLHQKMGKLIDEPKYVVIDKAPGFWKTGKLRAAGGDGRDLMLPSIFPLKHPLLEHPFPPFPLQSLHSGPVTGLHLLASLLSASLLAT